MKLVSDHLLGAFPVAAVALAIGRIGRGAARGARLDLARRRRRRGHEVYTLRLLGEVAARRDPPDVEASERHGGSFALLLLKLRPSQADSGRKLGRGDGDLLRSVATQVRSFIRGSDLVALISNDEFAVLMCGISVGAVAVLAGRLRESLEAPREGNGSGDITVDVGMAIYGDDGRTPEALVEAARASMTASVDDSPRIAPRSEAA